MATSLKKDETYNLYNVDAGGQPTGNGITVVRFGLRWEAVTAQRRGLGGWAERKLREYEGTTDPSDYDAGAIFLTGGDPKKYIGFGNQEPFKDESSPEERASARHSGDSIRGDGDGDDEYVDLTLAGIPKRYDQVILTGGAFKKGSQPGAVRDVKATLYDGTGGTFDAVGEYEPSLLSSHRMVAVACLTRRDSQQYSAWDLNIVNEGYNVTPGDFKSMLRAVMGLTLPGTR